MKKLPQALAIRPFSLEGLSFLYLFLPLAIFLPLTLRPGWLLAAVLLIGCCLWKSTLLVKAPSPWEVWPGLRRRQKLLTVATVLLLLAWVLLSGSGHFTWARADYQKHDAMLWELVHHQWPVAFSHPEGQGVVAYLHYYYGNYVVPASIGKLFGFPTAVRSVYLWNSLGMLLVLAWLCRAVGRLSWWLLPAAIAFGGFGSWLRWWQWSGTVADLLSAPASLASLLAKPLAIPLWEFGLRYPSNTDHLFWAPQHVLAAWILGGYLWTRISRQEAKPYDLLLFALSPFWSPFTAVGLTPFLLLHLAVSGPKKVWWSRESLLGVVLLLFFALYFSASAFAQPRAWLFAQPGWLPQLLSFLLAHLGPWFLLTLPLLRWGDRMEKVTLVLSYLLLVTIPLLVFGLANDWCMQVSVLPLWLVFILACRTLLRCPEGRTGRAYGLLFALTFLLASPNQGLTIYRSLTTPTTPIGQGGIDALPDAKHTVQYLAVPTAPFYRWLARQPSAAGQPLRPASWQILKTHHLKVWDRFYETFGGSGQKGEGEVRRLPGGPG